MSNRAFRISFDEKVSKFVIEIQGFLGMSWKSAKDANKVRYFETFEAAGKYVKEIGLDRIYEDFTFKAPFGSHRGNVNPPPSGQRPMHPVAPPPRNPNAVWSVPFEPYPSINKEQAA